MRGSLSRMRSKNIHASILCKACLVNKVQKTSEAPPVYLIKRHKNQNYSTVLLLTNMIIRRSFSHIKLPRSLNLMFNNQGLLFKLFAKILLPVNQCKCPCTNVLGHLFQCSIVAVLLTVLRCSLPLGFSVSVQLRNTISCSLLTFPLN